MTSVQDGVRLRLALGATALLLFALAAVMILTGRPPAGKPRTAADIHLPDPPPPELLPDRTAAADPTAFAPITREEAQRQNDAIAVSDLPIEAARPFNAGRMPMPDFERARDCLTAAIYYEAATEPDEGQRAVAQVVLNRVRHPAYPHSVCGVVFQGAERATGCQFTFACDGALARQPSTAGWARAQAVATAALKGYVDAGVGLATHYHTQWVLPYWSPKLVKLVKVGAHIFLRWQGGWGRPAAFRSAYLGAEPAIMWRGGYVPDPSAMGAMPLEQGGAVGAAPVLVPERPVLGVVPLPARASAAPGVGGTKNSATAGPGDVQLPYVDAERRGILGIAPEDPRGAPAPPARAAPPRPDTPPS